MNETGTRSIKFKTQEEANHHLQGKTINNVMRSLDGWYLKLNDQSELFIPWEIHRKYTEIGCEYLLPPLHVIQG